MIDLNTIISQALAAAVAQALQPIQQEYANKMGEMAQKIAALEYAQAFQADNLHARLRVLEGALTDRVLALETAEQPLTTFTMDALLERLDNQEWFWHKIRAFTDGAVEQAVEQHCEEYDHDEMLTSDTLPDMDEYIKREDLDSEVRDAVSEVMEGATVSIRI